MGTKVTKREMYELIKTKLANDNEIVEFCDHEIELLDRKKSNGKAKVNEKLDANVELVYNALVEVGEKVTATELIAKTDLSALANDVGVVTTQKVSAYLNKLVAVDRVEKVIEKKKTYFSVKA